MTRPKCRLLREGRYCASIESDFSLSTFLHSTHLTDDVIRFPREIIDITEPCKHSVQFNGLCVECGKDMTRFVRCNDGESLIILT